MPVLRSITSYRTALRNQHRRVRLHAAWWNMVNRCNGKCHAGNGARPWKGLSVGWKGWSEFREWALANGYSKRLCSLDRIDVSRGYGPDNCEWVTREENTRRQKFYQSFTADAPCHDVPF